MRLEAILGAVLLVAHARLRSDPLEMIAHGTPPLLRAV
jgi:hypothetical protein